MSNLWESEVWLSLIVYLKITANVFGSNLWLHAVRINCELALKKQNDNENSKLNILFAKKLTSAKRTDEYQNQD